MKAILARVDPARLRSLATGFAGVHSLNAALTMVYSLVQTLVFARALDHRLFSMTIVATAVGLYLLPINQSVARANFVLLRERAVKVSHRGAAEASSAFHLSQLILLLVPLAAPFALGIADGREYVAFASYLFFCTYSNIWYFEVQMSMMAVEQALPFERVSFIRRVVNYVILIALLKTHDFFLCNIAWALQTLVFHIYVVCFMARGWGLFDWPHGLTWGGMKRHFARLWVSLQATGAEWLTLNGPYSVFVARFGVGPGVVTIDTVLKLSRIVVSVTRNLSEIALPRVSRALLVGEARRGRMPVAIALAGGAAAALACGAVVVLFEHQAFSLLLSHNDVIPAGAGWPTAVALLAGVGVALGGHIIGYSGDQRSIPALLSASLLCMGAFAAYVLIGRPDILGALWATSAALSGISIVAMILLVRILRR